MVKHLSPGTVGEIQMDITLLTVNIVGLLLIGWIVWYFWLYHKEGVQVTEVAGVQEVPIAVRGGMTRT